jgi:predicted kinase
MTNSNNITSMKQETEIQQPTQTATNLNLQLQPHTVVLTCGPSGVGKSYCIRSILQHLDILNTENTAKGLPKLSYEYLSSDNLRYNILQESPRTLNKFHKRMAIASKQAFQLLENQLEVLMSYPINRDLIFVDTTALDKKWREHIIKLCRSKHYNVDLLLFNYNSRKDYYKFSANLFSQNQLFSLSLLNVVLWLKVLGKVTFWLYFKPLNASKLNAVLSAVNRLVIGEYADKFSR